MGNAEYMGTQTAAEEKKTCAETEHHGSWLWGSSCLERFGLGQCGQRMGISGYGFAGGAAPKRTRAGTNDIAASNSTKKGERGQGTSRERAANGNSSESKGQEAS